MTKDVLLFYFELITLLCTTTWTRSGELIKKHANKTDYPFCSKNKVKHIISGLLTVITYEMHILNS